MKRAIVCLSGGLDSAANLALAHQDYAISTCVFFDYGQISMRREHRAATLLCAHYGCELKTVSLPFFNQFDSALINGTVPSDDQNVNIECAETSERSAAAVWVPNRNGIFLNVAAAFAEQMKIKWLLTGFNIEEAKTFPDNSEEFLQNLNLSLSFSTANQVRVASLTSGWNKAQIVEEISKIQFPFELIWSCYLSEERWCGRCESCKRFERALGADKFEKARRQNAENMA